MQRKLGLTIIVAAVLAFVPANAAASSGSFTKATANSTWTTGDFEGSINWTDCGTNCRWLPSVTVQPTTSSYRCRGDEALDSDPDTRVVWSGGQQTTNTTVAFAVDDGSILSGVYGQRACLSVIDIRSERDRVCVAQAPILGYDPNTCAFRDYYYPVNLHSVLLTVDSDPPIGGGVTASQATTIAKGALKSKFGNRYEKGKRIKVKCSPAGDGYSCAVSWKYKAFRYSGAVIVASDGTPKVKVKKHRAKS